MLYTSYFAKIKNFPPNVTPIAICAIIPNWYKGLCYSILAPKYDSLIKYKDDHNEASYIECFNNSILKHLNPLWILADLRILLNQDGSDDLIPFWEDPDRHVALICYEKPSDFCHRHLIAEWLHNYGVECNEWE